MSHTDRPTTQDSLQFSDFRPTLLETLRTTGTPLTLGVFGNWGTGKTSLLRMLKRDLDEGDHPGPLRTVWFTAWKYDRHEALWRAFILRVLDALHPDHEARQAGEGATTKKKARGKSAKKDDQAKLLEKLQRLQESVYRPVEWQEMGRLTAEWGRLLPQFGKAAGHLSSASGNRSDPGVVASPSATLCPGGIALKGRSTAAEISRRFRCNLALAIDRPRPDPPFNSPGFLAPGSRRWSFDPCFRALLFSSSPRPPSKRVRNRSSTPPARSSR